MDKHILFVKSDTETTRALQNRNLVSFHKRFNCCFNATTLQKLSIHEGMYARFTFVDFDRRLIHITVRTERPDFEKSKWYKIRNPKVSKYNQYCYIRTTNLVYDFDLLPIGAFEYSCYSNELSPDINICIKF